MFGSAAWRRHREARARSARERLLRELRARAAVREAETLVESAWIDGLDRSETEVLGATLRDVQTERKMAILLVEHDVDFVRSLVTRVFVLDFGTLIAAGTTHDVFADAAVRRAYLGDMV